jgi:transcription factor TFIIIB component B''
LTQASNSDAPHKNTGPTTKKTRPSRAPPRPKRRAHEKSAATIVDSDDETEGVETENAAGNPEEENAQANEGQGAETARQKRVRKKPAKARKRKAAPAEGEQAEEEEGGSDPELHEVDPHALSMWELSHDTRHGKMSERGKKMDEIDWDDVVAKRRAAAELIASGGQSAVEGAASSTENANGTAEGRTEGEAGGETQRSQAASGPQPAAAADDGIDFELDEEGNIVENQASLAITRDAQAVAAAAADRPVEDVNDLTVHINRTTWINDNRREHTDRVPLWKWKSDPWSEDETDKFYDALCMFGTDFFIISKMFPPKTRRMIKAKFTREEKIDPQRINNALNGKNTRRLDLEHYARETARDISVFTRYEGLEHAQAMINESMKEKQDAMTTAAQKEAQVEEERREKDKQKEKTKGTRTRKSKKAMGGTFGGGGGPDDGD